MKLPLMGEKKKSVFLELNIASKDKILRIHTRVPTVRKSHYQFFFFIKKVLQIGRKQKKKTKYAHRHRC